MTSPLHHQTPASVLHLFEMGKINNAQGVIKYIVKNQPVGAKGGGGAVEKVT